MDPTCEDLEHQKVPKVDSLRTTEAFGTHPRDPLDRGRNSRPSDPSIARLVESRAVRRLARCGGTTQSARAEKKKKKKKRRGVQPIGGLLEK